MECLFCAMHTPQQFVCKLTESILQSSEESAIIIMVIL